MQEQGKHTHECRLRIIARMKEDEEGRDQLEKHYKRELDYYDQVRMQREKDAVKKRKPDENAAQSVKQRIRGEDRAEEFRLT